MVFEAWSECLSHLHHLYLFPYVYPYCIKLCLIACIHHYIVYEGEDYFPRHKIPSHTMQQVLYICLKNGRVLGE